MQNIFSILYEHYITRAFLREIYRQNSLHISRRQKAMLHQQMKRIPKSEDDEYDDYRITETAHFPESILEIAQARLAINPAWQKLENDRQQNNTNYSQNISMLDAETFGKLVSDKNSQLAYIFSGAAA